MSSWSTSGDSVHAVNAAAAAPAAPAAAIERAIEKIETLADLAFRSVQLHPTNEDVDYAEYRVGLSHFKDAPDEFFLFPPAYEKDQHSLESAVTDFRDLLQSRPGSKFAADAKARLEEATTRLARHEWYVAEFYYKRKRWAGAAGRLEGLVKNYPDSKYTKDANLYLAKSKLALGDVDEALAAFDRVFESDYGKDYKAETVKLA